MEKQTFTCRAHQLNFEYPADWYDHGHSEPCCPLCRQHEIIIIKQKLEEVEKHNDALLQAINLKLCAPKDTPQQLDATDANINAPLEEGVFYNMERRGDGNKVKFTRC